MPGSTLLIVSGRYPLKEKIFVQIGPVDTNRPEEIASVVAFLTSADAGYMTGQVLVVDAGHIY